MATTTKRGGRVKVQRLKVPGRRVGRPPEIPGRPRSSTLRVRLTADERAELWMRAEAAGLDVSEFVRRLLAN